MDRFQADFGDLYFGFPKFERVRVPEPAPNPPEVFVQKPEPLPKAENRYPKQHYCPVLYNIN
jgi:hypothetical protein